MNRFERDGLIARIRHIRRVAADARPAAPAPAPRADDPSRALAARLAHLEQMVQGLQDSVHRESTRLSKRLDELEARTQPAVLARVLSDDARDRGL